jgi:hypothetical protein
MEHYSNFPLSKIAIPGFAGGTLLIHSFARQIAEILSRHLGFTEQRQSSADYALSLYLRESADLVDPRREGTLQIQQSKEEPHMYFSDDLLRKLKVIDPDDKVRSGLDFHSTISRKLNARDYSYYSDIISVDGPFYQKMFSHLQNHLMADTYITVHATADLPLFQTPSTLTHQIQTTIGALNEFFSKEARNENQIVWTSDSYWESDYGYNMVFRAGILIHDRGFSETDRFNFEPGDLVNVTPPGGFGGNFYGLYLGDGKVRPVSPAPTFRTYSPLPYQMAPVSEEEVSPDEQRDLMERYSNFSLSTISAFSKRADSRLEEKAQELEDAWHQYLWSIADQITRTILQKKQELGQEQQRGGAAIDESVLIGLEQKKERLTEILSKIDKAYSQRNVEDIANEISDLASSTSLKGVTQTPELVSSSETIETSFRQLAEAIGDVLNQDNVVEAFDHKKGSIKASIFTIMKEMGAFDDQVDGALDEEQQLDAIYNAIERVQPAPISEYLPEQEIKNLNPQMQEAELDLDNDTAFINTVINALDNSEVFLVWAQDKLGNMSKDNLKKLIPNMKERPTFSFPDETWNTLLRDAQES